MRHFVLRRGGVHWPCANALADRFVFMTGGAFTQETSAFANRLGEKLLDKPFGPTDVGVALAYLLEKDAPSTS